MYKTFFLSGHGLGVEKDNFELPPKVFVKFITRDNTSVLDTRTQWLENNPSLIHKDRSVVINQYGKNYKPAICPDYYLLEGVSDGLRIGKSSFGNLIVQPNRGKYVRLSTFVEMMVEFTNPPFNIVWSACRFTKPSHKEVKEICASYNLKEANDLTGISFAK